MEIKTVVKFGVVEFVKAYLRRLRDVNHGTTVAGTIATILLASSIVDISKLICGSGLERAVEAGKALGLLLFWLTMRAIGKPVNIEDVLKAKREAK